MAAPFLHEADAIFCPVVDYQWSFANTQSQEIERHWNKLKAARPALFNGRVFLACETGLVVSEGAVNFQALHFETDFRDFIAWRDFGFPAGGVQNCFAMAAVRSSDGAYLLGRMGAHTANAGLVYFPAGTPDRDDLADGELDFERSARRELLEETGLDAQMFEDKPGWTIVSAGARIACIKEFHAGESARLLRARVEAFMAWEAESELAGVELVSSAADIDGALMPDFVKAFLSARLC